MDARERLADRTGGRRVGTYAPAARFLGVRRPEALDPEFWAAEPAHGLLEGGGLEARVHVFTPAGDLGGRKRREVSRLAGLQAITRATATALDVDDGGIASLRAMTAAGREFRVKAGRYVLACGGLENTRLLLMLARARPGVLGTSGELVGRGYMNHVRSEGVGRLYLDRGHRDYRRLFRRLTRQYSGRSGGRVQMAAALAEQIQRGEGLPNATSFCHAVSEPRLAAVRTDLGRLAAGIRSRDPREALAIAARLAGAVPTGVRAAAAWAGGVPYLIDHLVLVDQVEQRFDAASCVVLGDGRDALGRPPLRLDWRVGPEAVAAARRLHQLLAARLAGQGVGRLESPYLGDPDFEPPVGDSRHPMGTTRMSVDPRHGVVDPDLRVHAVENLYVAGSSVFPAGGAANPTLSIVALSLRLADHLLGAI